MRAMTHMCDMTHSYVWHDSISYVCHDVSTLVTWRIHMWDMTTRVQTCIPINMQTYIHTIHRYIRTIFTRTHHCKRTHSDCVRMWSNMCVRIEIFTYTRTLIYSVGSDCVKCTVFTRSTQYSHKCTVITQVFSLHTYILTHIRAYLHNTESEPTMRTHKYPVGSDCV